MTKETKQTKQFIKVNENAPYSVKYSVEKLYNELCKRSGEDKAKELLFTNYGYKTVLKS